MRKALSYIIASSVGAVIVIIIVCAQRIWESASTTQIMGVLSDAFFAAGVCLGGVGLIVFASEHGLFDMLGYAVRLFFDLFRRDVTKRKYKDFKEYREARAAREKKSTAFLLLVGLAYIAVAGIFLIVYYFN